MTKKAEELKDIITVLKYEFPDNYESILMSIVKIILTEKVTKVNMIDSPEGKVTG